jgi:hypothetical protein
MEQQALFSGGLNANNAIDKLAEGECSDAVNVDFGLDEGAAQCRRGCKVFATVPGATGLTVRAQYVNHNNPYNLGRDPHYIALGYWINRGADGTFTGTAIASTGTGQVVAFSFYDNLTLIAAGQGTNYWADDGTTVTQWVKESPSHAPNVTYIPASTATLGTVYGAIEGTLVAGGTNTATLTTTANRIVVQLTPTSTNLTTIGSDVVGTLGSDSVRVTFSNPGGVTLISKDFSVGDANFNNYFHFELDPSLDTTVPLEVLTEINSASDASAEDKTAATENVSTTFERPSPNVSPDPRTANALLTTRNYYNFIGDASGADWSDIKAIRLIIDCNAAQEVIISDWILRAGDAYPLTDMATGYTYFETWAVVDSAGDVVAESAPSPASAPLLCQNVAGKVVSTSTASGTTGGFTHRIFYRQGGYTTAPYAVATTSFAVTTATDSKSDVQALLENKPLTYDLYSRASIPGNVTAISKPYFERVFMVSLNQVYWSLPGQPHSFPKTSSAQVSNVGDETYAIVNWNPLLVFVNRDSVYEMSGTIFEGDQANWSLYRTGCRRGTKAPYTAIETPAGIPLLDYDGLYLYVPGRGAEVPIDWVMDKIGDAWKGENSTDPANYKGLRVPAINRGYLRNSFAVWAENRLYLAMPTGTDQIPKTMFVLDFLHKRVWYYTYNFAMYSGYWDFVTNRLMVGTTDGVIMQIEYGPTEVTPAGTAATIPWKVRTKRWDWPSDALLTNINIVSVGSNTGTAIVNSTAALTLGTRTSVYALPTMPSLQGTNASSVQFEFAGTSAAASVGPHSLYKVAWDALPEPPRVLYARTEYVGGDQEYEWKVQAATLDCLLGTVTGTMFVDSTAVATFTYSGNGPQGFARAIPQTQTAGVLNHIYGRSAYMVYTGTSVFKHYFTQFEKLPEPSRVVHYRTPTNISREYEELKTLNAELNCLNATVLGTVIVEGTAVMTATFTGSGYQTFTKSLPIPTFGKAWYVIYSAASGNFKHYNTWMDATPQPNLVTSLRTELEVFEGEHEIRTLENELDCLGSTVTGTVYVDSTAVGSPFTFTGSGEQGYVRSLPVWTYGRSAYVIYTASGYFKHFKSWFHKTPEPSRVSSWRTPNISYQSDQIFKTWIADLNPNGTCTGVFYINDVPQSTSAFVGTHRDTFNIGIDFYGANSPMENGDQAYCIYTGTNFKHYETKFNTDPMPFLKSSHYVEYTKIGGASQLDLARFWSIDIEGIAGVVTIVWDVDGQAFGTSTITHGGGRTYYDRLPPPPGIRGFLFRHRVTSTVPIHVWRASIDTQQTGIKGLSRKSVAEIIK